MRPVSPTMRRHLEAIALGETVDETARRLFVSVDTTKTHRRRLFAALGARNGAHAVAVGYELGLLGDGTSREHVLDRRVEPPAAAPAVPADREARRAAPEDWRARLEAIRASKTGPRGVDLSRVEELLAG